MQRNAILCQEGNAFWRITVKVKTQLVFLFKENGDTDLVQLWNLEESAGDEAGQRAYIIDWGIKERKSSFRFGGRKSAYCLLRN